MVVAEGNQDQSKNQLMMLGVTKDLTNEVVSAIVTIATIEEARWQGERLFA